MLIRAILQVDILMKSKIKHDNNYQIKTNHIRNQIFIDLNAYVLNV